MTESFEISFKVMMLLNIHMSRSSYVCPYYVCININNYQIFNKEFIKTVLYIYIYICIYGKYNKKKKIKRKKRFKKNKSTKCIK